MVVAARQRASLPIDGKVLLFNNWKNDHSLFLYERDVEVHGAIFSFIESGLENEELCLFAYDNTTGKLYTESVFKDQVQAGMLHLFPMGDKNIQMEIQELDKKLREMYRQVPKNYHTLRVVADFGSLTTSRSLETVIGCVKGIMEKRNERLRLPWSRTRYRAKKMTAPFPLRTLIAFNVESLPNGAVNTLLEIHENVVISARNEYTMSLLNYRSGEIPDLISVETIPRETLERFVKKHLDTIILSLLLRNPMCGYDLIRTIYQRYHTFLSQGTVYPLLYDLERRELLGIVKSGSPRSKVYALTDHGGKEAKTRINDFISTQRYLLESIRE